MIGERLKKLRKDKGITQKELADILGIEKSNISAYEIDKNTPPDDIKVSLARYFNISLDYLLGVINTEVNYYSENIFLKLPDNISSNDRNTINDFVEFILFRSTKR